MILKSRKIQYIRGVWMTDKKDKIINLIISVLFAWIGFMFILYTLVNVNWFHSGDFDFHAAMAYHGILVPVWLILALTYLRDTEQPVSILKLVTALTVVILLLFSLQLLKPKRFF
jgi:uncharacterized membrane protein